MATEGMKSSASCISVWLLATLVLTLSSGVSARSMHSITNSQPSSGCPCGYLINIFGITVNICKPCATNAGPPTIPSPPPPSPSPEPPSTLYLVRVNNKCNESVILTLQETKGLKASFAHLEANTGGVIGQSYLPVVVYGYGVESRKGWQGDNCFVADSKFNTDPIVLKNEPVQRTVCGITIPKFNRTEYLPEAAFDQGEIDFTCEEPAPALAPAPATAPHFFFHLRFDQKFGKSGR